MKKLKNTGYKLTISLNSAGTLCGNVATSTSQFLLSRLLKKYPLFNTTIKELPGSIYPTSQCTTNITTLLQVDFHTPDNFLPNHILEELKETISPEIHLLRYQIVAG